MVTLEHIDRNHPTALRCWALAHESKHNPKTIHVGHRGEYERDSLCLCVK